uniref:Uncharacterized protein n=1 Tax=Rhipicephalus microplus TaxID=6941 RepID=A0A6G5AET2_RHIMP
MKCIYRRAHTHIEHTQTHKNSKHIVITCTNQTLTGDLAIGTRPGGKLIERVCQLRTESGTTIVAEILPPQGRQFLRQKRYEFRVEAFQYWKNSTTTMICRNSFAPITP